MHSIFGRNSNESESFAVVWEDYGIAYVHCYRSQTDDNGGCCYIGGS